MRAEKMFDESRFSSVKFHRGQEAETGERMLRAVGLAMLEAGIGQAPFQLAAMAVETRPGDKVLEKEAFFTGLKTSQNQLTLEEALEVVNKHTLVGCVPPHPYINFDYVNTPYGVYCVKLAADMKVDGVVHFYHLFGIGNNEAMADKICKRAQEILDANIV
ncbi:MAG: hypothetical protein Q7R94_00360 [bacterium]|nr:hypothetical protein [bacterium]